RAVRPHPDEPGPRGVPPPARHRRDALPRRDGLGGEGRHGKALSGDLGVRAAQPRGLPGASAEHTAPPSPRRAGAPAWPTAPPSPLREGTPVCLTTLRE